MPDMVNQAGRRLQPHEPFRFRDALKALGPGLITGASDDDPSGIGTYSQAGAQLGFGIGWTMLLTFPLMAAIQEIPRASAASPATASPAMSAGTIRVAAQCGGGAAVRRQHHQHRRRSRRHGGRDANS